VGVATVFGVLGSVATSPAAAVRAEVVDPAECRVALRSPASIAALIGTPASGGPDATPDPVLMRVDRENELPQGRPADAETVTAIVEVERQLVACNNAGDLPRILALLTDDAARMLLGFPIENVAGVETVADQVATPASPLDPDEWIALFPVRDVRVLTDGRVGAIVETAYAGVLETVAQTVFHFYERVDGRWRIAGEVSGFEPNLRGGEQSR
jgi:hypothetical protein